MSTTDSMTDPLPFDRVADAGHYGAPGEPGVVATIREDLAFATLAARKGQKAALAARVSAAFGLVLPEGPRASGDADLALLGVAPGRWLAVSQTRPELAAQLAGACAELSAVTEQSDALVTFDLSGGRVLDLLAKGPAIDLDSAVFRPGDVAVTDIAHVGATLWRTGEATYRALVARSFAPSFSRFLVAGAAEYGLSLQHGRGAGRG